MYRAFALLALTACDLDLDPGGDSGGGGFESLRDVVDLSVNDASAGVVDDDAGGLRLRAEAGENLPGGFNGEGVGNKSIAGLTGFDGLALGELSLLAMETSSAVGGTTPYFNVVVDLACGCDDLVLMVADTTLASAADLGGGVTRYTYLAGDAQWKAVGGLDDILPAHLESTGGALTDVLAAYPMACLRDADTGDYGMPADTVTTAIMAIVGDSVNVSELEHRVSAIEVGASRYTAD